MLVIVVSLLVMLLILAETARQRAVHGIQVVLSVLLLAEVMILARPHRGIEIAAVVNTIGVVGCLLEHVIEALVVQVGQQVHLIVAQGRLGLVIQPVECDQLRVVD